MENCILKDQITISDNDNYLGVIGVSPRMPL